MAGSPDGADDWDAEAATFDDEPDHGLRDPAVRAAWRALLVDALPTSPSDVADLGCGTGTLSVLLAELGHRVTGLDASAAMLDAARAKAAGLQVRLVLGDAAAPALEPGGFDVVLSRHVLWALPDVDAALAAWARLLRPGGRLVLVEGLWHTGAGIRADRLAAAVDAAGFVPVVRPLPDPALWGGPIRDERYLLTAVRAG